MESYLDCIVSAAEMLKIEPKELSESLIYGELAAKLVAIDALALSVGPCLRSRQIIAGHVYDWQQRHQP